MMTDLGDCSRVFAFLVLAIYFFVAATRGLIRGRIRINGRPVGEPEGIWINSRDHPIKFVGSIILHFCVALFFADMAMSLALTLLG